MGQRNLTVRNKETGSILPQPCPAATAIRPTNLNRYNHAGRLVQSKSQKTLLNTNIKQSLCFVAPTMTATCYEVDKTHISSKSKTLKTNNEKEKFQISDKISLEFAEKSKSDQNVESQLKNQLDFLKEQEKEFRKVSEQLIDGKYFADSMSMVQTDQGPYYASNKYLQSDKKVKETQTR